MELLGKKEIKVREDYYCGKCKVRGVRLWREYGMFIRKDCLRCTKCRNTKCLDIYVMAVPCGDSEDFYGLTAIPHYKAEWWNNLPEAKSPNITLPPSTLIIKGVYQ